MTAAISPVRPSSPVGIGQEKSSFFIIEFLKHSPSELRTHSVCKAVPYKLVQFQCACFDPLFQADAFTQAARMLTVIVLTVFAPDIIGRIMKRAAVYPTTSRFLARLRHHQLLHCLQRCISHEIAWHKRTPFQNKKGPESSCEDSGPYRLILHCLFLLRFCVLLLDAIHDVRQALLDLLPHILNRLLLVV